ncbi:MAG: hypothetical protein ACXVX3_00405 [Blastococcus sp.]
MSALVDARLAIDQGWSTVTERSYRSVVRTCVVPALAIAGGAVTANPAETPALG